MLKFKLGIIRNVEVIKNTEGLYKLEVETEKEILKILTYLLEENSLSELYNRRVFVRNGLKRIRLHGESKNEIFLGMGDDFSSPAIRFINR